MSDYQQLKEKFDQLLIVDGQYNKSKWNTFEGKALRQKVDEASIPEFNNLDEKIWALRFSTEIRPKCVVCGNQTRLKKNKFNDTCSASCAKLNPATAEKTRLTMQEEYGVDFPSQSKDVRKKIEQACMDKYGVRVSSMAPEVTEKRKATNIEKYGVANVLFRPDVREKTLELAASVKSRIKRSETLKKTHKEFGEEIQDARKKTCLEKYGVEHPLQNSEVMEKINATNLEKYGVKSVLSHGETREKIAKEKLKKYEIHELPLKLTKILTEVNTELIDEKIWLGHLHHYNWKHLTCGREFTSDLNDGKFPECPHCKPRSKPQAKIKAILDKLGVFYRENDRTQIKPYEIDFWIPDHNLGIEVNGVYWHHDDTTSLPLLKKTELVEETGAQLLHFWDFEINEKLSIIESILKSKLNLLDRKIYARKCTLVEVTNQEAQIFFQSNHLAGYAPAKINLGLVHDGELVALGSFSKNRFSKEDANELVRFAVLKNTHVQGGLSKIISRFKLDHQKPLISFADRRISNGRGYRQIKFIESAITSPNYFYEGYGIRISRQKAMKHKLPNLLGSAFDVTKTELENMSNAGWVKCSDAGNYRFVL